MFLKWIKPFTSWILVNGLLQTAAYKLAYKAFGSSPNWFSPAVPSVANNTINQIDPTKGMSYAEETVQLNLVN